MLLLETKTPISEVMNEIKNRFNFKKHIIQRDH